MSFSEEEQPSGFAVGPGRMVPAEPRLLTRPDRPTTPKPTPLPKRDAGPETSPAPRPRPKRQAPKAAGSRRRVHLWGAAGAVGFVLLAVAVMGGILYLRHAMMAALPQIDGSKAVAGLRAPVTVTRDAQGVPTITAGNLQDLLFAQGYTTAGDRLWQMDGLRRHAAGELAEVLGPGLVEHDRRQRYLQIRAAADRAVAQLPADQLAQLEAYARGVNAYIATHRDSLPIEFRLLAYEPAPWTARDSLLVSLAMWQDLSTDFPGKMNREALSSHLPKELTTDLYPVGSWRDQPPAAQNRDISAPHEVEQIPLDPSQSRMQRPDGAATPSPRTLLAVSSALTGSGRCEGCRSGSNNWVISGAHTASGAPLLSNDMHLSLAIPDIWYEASLHAGVEPRGGESGPEAARLDVTGFTLPGVPFVIVGRNAHVAWGVTNLGADVQDLRVEHLRGEGEDTAYQRADGTWTPATHRMESIHVRGGRNITLDVLTTTHAGPSGPLETPIISSLYPGETRALSLAWTAYDPGAVSSPFLGVDTATNGASLVSAMAHFGGPSLNLVWADAEGHIGYHAVGLVPVRGPAVQHPRAVTAPIIDPGATPPDEGTEEPASPEVSLAPGPHLLLSSYAPAQRRRAAPVHTRRPAAPRGRGSRGRIAAAPARVRRASRPRPEPQPQAEAPLPPAPPVIDYTIGSPISYVPVDALNADQAWTAYVPFNALPSVLDPKNGLLATANARISADDYLYALADNWTDPFRVERIVHLLQGRKGLTPPDMLHMETDAYSDVNHALAQRLAYAVDHASQDALSQDAGRLHEAANVLRAWNGEMSTDSPGAAIISVMRPALWSALLVPKIAAHDGVDPQQAASLALLYTWGEKSTALELLVQHEPARWLPKGSTNWNDFLATTLGTALRSAQAPSNLQHWRYGEIHTVEINHPVFSTHRWLSRLVGVRASTGAKPAPGDGTTIDAIGAHFGPSERFTADLSSPEAALGNITTGQSANPGSPWYLDQFRPWLEGRSFALPTASTEATHTLTLHP